MNNDRMLHIYPMFKYQYFMISRSSQPKKCGHFRRVGELCQSRPPGIGTFWRHDVRLLCTVVSHRIGLWENLQESPIFDSKNHGFL